MDFIAKYIIGSEDSLDIDTCYVVQTPPKNPKIIVDSILDENANIVTIKNGVVDYCYKGVSDEMNNCLIDTYKLHEQNYPLLVERRVLRDIIQKDLRVVRGILSYLSRTPLRSIVKEALRSGFSRRLNTLQGMAFSEIDFDQLSKKFNGAHALKVIAFQLGQGLGLHEGKEFYTKKTIANNYSELEPFLYRRESSIEDLQKIKDCYCEILQNFYSIEDLENQVSIINGEQWDMKKEQRL